MFVVPCVFPSFCGFNTLPSHLHVHYDLPGPSTIKPTILSQVVEGRPAHRQAAAAPLVGGMCVCIRERERKGDREREHTDVHQLQRWRTWSHHRTHTHNMRATWPAPPSQVDSWDCLRELVGAWERAHGPMDDFSMRHTRLLSNLCNAGVRGGQVGEAAAAAARARGEGLHVAAGAAAAVPAASAAL